MDPSLNPLLLDAAILVILLAAWLYFRRVRVERPPVGAFNLRDIAFTLVVLVIIPPLYLELPTWLVASILVVTATGLTYFTVTPVFGRRAALVTASGLAVSEVVLSSWRDGRPTGFLLLNDIAVGLLVVGVCNIWAQSGVRARDVTIFACAVGVFDLVATGFLPLMLDFFSRVHALPFAPVLATGTGGNAAAIGMGDLLFIVLWPLVTTKAFARRAGLLAAAGTGGCAVALGVAFSTRLLTTAVPAMVFIAPVILVQYLLFRRHYRTERTTGEYEAAIRADAPTQVPFSPTPLADITAALALIEPDDRGRPARYLAVHNKAIIASANTPGAAIIAARKAAPDANPVLVLAAGRRRPQ